MFNKLASVLSLSFIDVYGNATKSTFVAAPSKLNEKCILGQGTLS